MKEANSYPWDSMESTADDDIYMTDEELSRMTPDEIETWLSSVNEALRTAQGSGELTVPGISLEDLDRAYESKEYRDFLEHSDDMDIKPVLFEDGEDIMNINSRYQALRGLGAGLLTDEKIKAYDDLYSALYPYIRRVNPLWEVGADRLDIWADLQDEYHTVYTLTPESAGPFAGLCSADEFALIGKESIYSFGCVRRVEGEDRACGIIIFEIHPEDEDNIEPVAEIKWLYVDESFRGMHAGDSLVAAMYHALNRAGIRAVCVDIPMRDILPVTAGDFLSGWWIYFKAEPRMKAFIPLSQIMESTSGIGHNRLGGYGTLSSLGEDLFSDGIRSVLKNTDENGYELADTDTLEPDLSMIQLISSKPQSFLLVDRMPSGMLKVRRLAGKTTDDSPYLQLIRFAAGEALKKYPPETPVCIEPVSDMSIDIYERLFPEAGMPVYLAGANISFEGGLTSDEFEELRVIYEQEKARTDQD